MYPHYRNRGGPSYNTDCPPCRNSLVRRLDTIRFETPKLEEPIRLLSAPIWCIDRSFSPPLCLTEKVSGTDGLCSIPRDSTSIERYAVQPRLGVKKRIHFVGLISAYTSSGDAFFASRERKSRASPLGSNLT